MVMMGSTTKLMLLGIWGWLGHVIALVIATSTCPSLNRRRPWQVNLKRIIQTTYIDTFKELSDNRGQSR